MVDFGIEGDVYRIRRTLTILLSVLLLPTACSPQLGPVLSSPADPVGGPSTASVDAVAVQRRIEDFIGSQTAAMDNVRAVLVVVDGQTTLEYYRHGFTAKDHEHLWSVTKSVVSTLVGIAIGEGLIPDLDTSLQALLPEYRKVMTPTAATITLRQLMNHTSGIIGDQSLEYTVLTGRSDPVAWALSKQEAQLTSPGVVFRYSSLGSHLVSAVLHSALQRKRPTLLIRTTPVLGSAGGKPARFIWARGVYGSRRPTWPRSASCTSTTACGMGHVCCHMAGWLKPPPPSRWPATLGCCGGASGRVATRPAASKVNGSWSSLTSGPSSSLFVQRLPWTTRSTKSVT
jgi:hypothetical protein